MEGIQLLIDQWLAWQFRAFLLSAIILFVAAPSHWRSPLLRHWALVSGALVLIVFPVSLWVFPPLVLAVIPSQITLDPFSSPVHMAIEMDRGSIWMQLFFAASAATSIVLILRYVKAWIGQSKKLAAGKAPDTELQQRFLGCVNEVGLSHKNIELVIGASNEAPCTCGWLRPKILIPEGAALWEKDDLRIVLIHELQHVKRRDWLWQQCVFVLLLLYPLNPFVWRIKRAARCLAEESVDKLSLSLGIAPMTYANTLLNQLRLCRQARSSVAVHMHQRIDIAERVGSLISEPYSWPQINRSHSLPVSLLLLILAVPFAVVHFDQVPAAYRFGELVVPLSWSPEIDEAEVSEQPSAGGARALVTLIDIPEIPPGQGTEGLATVALEKFEVEFTVLSPRQALPNVTISREPRPVYLQRPPYPSGALRRGQEATVEVVFDLNDAGDVINPRILNPGGWGSRQFEQAAIEAISASRYDVDESKGQLFFKRDLTQTYVFELVDENRPPGSENLAQHPP